MLLLCFAGGEHISYLFCIKVTDKGKLQYASSSISKYPSPKTKHIKKTCIDNCPHKKNDKTEKVKLYETQY